MPMLSRLNKICIPNVSNELVTILDLCMLFLCIFNQFARCFRNIAGSRMWFAFTEIFWIVSIRERKKKKTKKKHITTKTKWLEKTENPMRK